MARCRCVFMCACGALSGVPTVSPRSRSQPASGVGEGAGSWGWEEEAGPDTRAPGFSAHPLDASAPPGHRALRPLPRDPPRPGAFPEDEADDDGQPSDIADDVASVAGSSASRAGQARWRGHGGTGSGGSVGPGQRASVVPPDVGGRATGYKVHRPAPLGAAGEYRQFTRRAPSLCQAPIRVGGRFPHCFPTTIRIR
jgi:hypothetical protein